MDNIIADYTYENTVTMSMLRQSGSFRDDGYTIFESSGTVETKVEEELKEEYHQHLTMIKYFGLVLKGSEEKEPYILQLFDPSGQRSFPKDLMRVLASVDVDFYHVRFGKCHDV